MDEPKIKIVHIIQLINLKIICGLIVIKIFVHYKIKENEKSGNF